MPLPPHRPSTTSAPCAPSVRRGNCLSATLQDSPLDPRTTEGLRDRSRRVWGGEEWTVQGRVGALDRAGRRREEQPAGHLVSTQAKGWRAAPGTATLHRFPRWRGGNGATASGPTDGKGRSREHPGGGGGVIATPPPRGGAFLSRAQEEAPRPFSMAGGLPDPAGVRRVGGAAPISWRLMDREGKRRPAMMMV